MTRLTIGPVTTTREGLRRAGRRDGAGDGLPVEAAEQRPDPAVPAYDSVVEPAMATSAAVPGNDLRVESVSDGGFYG